MPLASHPAVYDEIGLGYNQHRRADPRIAAQIGRALGGAQRVCNVGAGAGSYEPSDSHVIAVEPSSAMLAQRNDTRSVRAVAERLPFGDASFDASLAVLTVHHWLDLELGLAELARVAPRQVVFGFVPDAQDEFWLVRDYLPEISALDTRRSPGLERVVAALGATRVEVIPIPWDCTDGFQAAYWRRPERYLEASVRASISTLAVLEPAVVQEGVGRLEADLRSGVWQKRNAALLERDTMDWGYRLIIAGDDAG